MGIVRASYSHRLFLIGLSFFLYCFEKGIQKHIYYNTLCMPRQSFVKFFCTHASIIPNESAVSAP